MHYDIVYTYVSFGHVVLRIAYITVDGIFNSWSNWTSCTLTCGGGTQDRYRDCKGPFHDGMNCTGDWDQRQDCNTQNCPGMLGE